MLLEAGTKGSGALVAMGPPWIGMKTAYEVKSARVDGENKTTHARSAREAV